MEITCAQMDVLISFYIEGDLSKVLKTKVEEHLQQCSACREKYDIIKTLLCDLKDSINEKEEVSAGGRYNLFRNNLSAYVDNELSTDENIKIRKYTINNKSARKKLEETYNIRKLMNDSYNKTANLARRDFTPKVMRRLNPDEEYRFHPVLKVAAAFVITVLVLSAIIVFSLTL